VQCADTLDDKVVMVADVHGGSSEGNRTAGVA